MTTAIIYKDRMLPPELHIEFTRWYARAEKENPCEIIHMECTRCGAMVPSAQAERHVQWHKNVSVDMFLMQKFVHDHIQQHIAFDDGISELMSGLMHLVDGVAMEADVDEITNDAGEVVTRVPREHTHEDGSTHAH